MSLAIYMDFFFSYSTSLLLISLFLVYGCLVQNMKMNNFKDNLRYFVFIYLNLRMKHWQAWTIGMGCKSVYRGNQPWMALVGGNKRSASASFLLSLPCLKTGPTEFLFFLVKSYSSGSVEHKEIRALSRTEVK